MDSPDAAPTRPADAPGMTVIAHETWFTDMTTYLSPAMDLEAKGHGHDRGMLCAYDLAIAARG